MPGIELEVNGDTKGAQDALNRLIISFDKFEAAIDKFAIVIDKLEGKLGTKLPAAAGKAKKAIDKVPNSSDQATQSLINLSRVAQDAPYGFIGIANNLNPLLESFQRLKASTGSTGSAFSALKGALTGPAGIGLALGVVSSLLVVFGDKLFGAGKAAKEAEENIKNLAKGVADDITKMTTLVGLINNNATSTENRNKALKAFNQEYDKYLKNLGYEEITLGNVNKAYEAIIDNLLKQAVVKGIQDQISASVQKTAESLIKLQIEEEKRRIASEQAQSAEEKAAAKREQTALLYKNLANQYAQGAKDGAIAQQEFNASQNAANSIASSYEERIKAIKGELMQTLRPLLNLTTNFEDLGISLDKTGNKGESAMNKIISEAKRVAAYFDARTNRVFQFDANPELSLAENAKNAQEFINRALDAGQRQTFEFKVNARLRFNQVTVDEKTFEDIQKDDKRTRAALEKQIEERYKTNPIRALVQAELQLGEQRRVNVLQQLGLSDPKNNILPKYLQDAINLANTVNGLLTPAFQGLFDAILQGENPLKAFFNSLGQSVAQLIQKLVAAAIQAAILSAIFPGGISGVKGFGGFFKNVLGFAQGGLVTGPTLSLIGEGVGTSRSNPEVVAPLDQLRSMLGDLGGGGNVTVLVSGRIRGNDLALSNARTSRRNGRLGA